MTLRYLKAISLASVAVLSLSACGWLQEDVASSSYNDWQSAAAETPAPPATRVMQTAEGTWLEPDKVAKPVPTANEIAELKQANKRIAALETQIAALQNDMKMMMPALTRLAGTDAAAMNSVQPAAGGVSGGEVPRIHRNYMQGQDFYGDDQLYEDPETAMDAPLDPPPAASASSAEPLAPAPAPVQAKPVAHMASPTAMVPGAPVAINPQAQAPAQPIPAAYTPPALNVTSIQGLRFGNHDGGKSRMVLDVSAATSFKYDIDNNEKFLVIEVPGTVWNAGPVTRVIQDNPLLQSVAASPDGQGGTRLVFQLKAPVKILWSQAIPPAGTQGHRLVFDVAAL